MFNTIKVYVYGFIALVIGGFVFYTNNIKQQLETIKREKEGLQQNEADLEAKIAAILKQKELEKENENALNKIESDVYGSDPDIIRDRLYSDWTRD